MKEQTPKHQLDFIEHCLMIQQARTIRTTISPWHFLFPQVSRNGIYHRFPNSFTYTPSVPVYWADLFEIPIPQYGADLQFPSYEVAESMPSEVKTIAP